jgi:hypothetical protein
MKQLEEYMLALPKKTPLFHGLTSCSVSKPELPKSKKFLFTSKLSIAKIYSCNWILTMYLKKPLVLFVITRQNVRDFLKKYDQKFPSVCYAMRQVLGIDTDTFVRFDSGNKIKLVIPKYKQKHFNIFTEGYLTKEDSAKDIYASARLSLELCKHLKCDGWIYPPKKLVKNVDYDERKRVSKGGHFHDEVMLCGKTLTNLSMKWKSRDSILSKKYSSSPVRL